MPTLENAWFRRLIFLAVYFVQGMVTLLMLRLVSRRHTKQLTRKKPGRTVREITQKIKKKPQAQRQDVILEEEEPEVLKD